MDNFDRPYVLLFLLPWLVLIFIHYKKRFTTGFFTLRSDRNQIQKNNFFRIKNYFRNSIDILYYLTFFILILAAAGPGKKYKLKPNLTEGIDIMLALDISGSMVNSYDFLPNNRLSVSKILLEKFVLLRQSDRLGLVLFAGAAYLQSPLTNDLTSLQQLIKEVSDESIEEQGTAIGDAIVLSTYRLKDTSSPSKVLILITDGVSNTGKIDMETAAFAAKTYGIKIYTIGIGKEDSQYEVNFETLAKIAESTDGVFFRAESPEILEDVLYEINTLEKVELSGKPLEILETRFPQFLFFAFLFLLLATALKVYPFVEKL
ncbi:MAG: VWA domain-containing protein [Leptospira sp.]|nr:VWA domain-containing protein [Leptospira sp.]